MIAYRREVDGLRALAVLPVILFHAGVPSLQGGFVGVDVFFVISGYLITSILVRELEADRYSIVRFYERRARRILPALVVVIAACLPAAWRWLSPRDLQDFAQSVFAVGVFASNVLFWRESGYFDSAAELKPLLHTWSLAVEEQFYLIFPLLLAAVWRFGRRSVAGLILVLAMLSLGLAQWAASAHPDASFYLLPTRAWGLAIGALLALAPPPASAVRGGKEATRQELLAGIGLVLIGGSILLLDETTPFPSLWALLPTVGTACVVRWATSETWVGRALGHPVPVGIGLVS